MKQKDLRFPVAQGTNHVFYRYNFKDTNNVDNWQQGMQSYSGSSDIWTAQTGNTPAGMTPSRALAVPHGVLFRGNSEQHIRTKLLKDGHIDTVIGLPADLFYSTGIRPASWC